MSNQNFVLVTFHRVSTHGILSDKHQSAWSATSVVVQESFPNLKFSTNFVEEETFNAINLLLKPDKKVNSFYAIMPSVYFELYNKTANVEYTYDTIKGVPNNITNPFTRMLNPLGDSNEYSPITFDLIRKIIKEKHEIEAMVTSVIYEVLSSSIRFGCSIFGCDLSNIMKSHDDLKRFILSVITDESFDKLPTEILDTSDPNDIVQWIKRYLPNMYAPTCIDICNKDIVKLHSLPKGRLTFLGFVDCFEAGVLYHMYYDSISKRVEGLCHENNTSIQINWIWTSNNHSVDLTEINKLVCNKSYPTIIYDNVVKLTPWSPIVIYEPDVINSPDIVHIYNGQFNKDKLQYNSSSTGSLNPDKIKVWIEKKINEYSSGKTLAIVSKIKETHNNSNIVDYDLIIDVGCPTVDLAGTIRLSVTGGEPIIIVNDGTPTIHVTGGAPKITVKKGKPNIKLQGGKPHITYV